MQTLPCLSAGRLSLQPCMQGSLRAGEATEVVISILVVGGRDGTAELLTLAQVLQIRAVSCLHLAVPCPGLTSGVFCGSVSRRHTARLADQQGKRYNLVHLQQACGNQLADCSLLGTL